MPSSTNRKKPRMNASKRVYIVLIGLLGSSAYAQWVNYPSPGTPRTRDGKPNLTAPAPRASNGKPDLSGVWHVQPDGKKELTRLFGADLINAADATSVPGMELDTISKYAVNILLDFKAGEEPMRPEAAKIFQQRASGSTRDPGVDCLPLGIPISSLVSEVHKIVQTPGLIVDLLEVDNAHRQIYTDGRKLPQDPQPSWLGYSVGRWDAGTLVVDTAGFNDKAWLDVLGHPRSEALHIVERYHRRDFGHLDIEMTFDDPKMYTKPFAIKVTHQLLPDSDILEYFCAENERDRAHVK
jgi:hypothetical protein